MHNYNSVALKQYMYVYIAYINILTPAKRKTSFWDVYCLRPTDVPGANIIALRFISIAQLYGYCSALCVMTTMVTCTVYTALSMYLYMH